MITATFLRNKEKMKWLPNPPRKIDFISDHFLMYFNLSKSRICIDANPVEFRDFLISCEELAEGEYLERDEPLSGDIFRATKLTEGNLWLPDHSAEITLEESKEMCDAIERLFDFVRE